MNKEEFKENLSEILENLAPSGIFQDRYRPYNGQPHTHTGIRGTQQVERITMRDISDCLRIAIWESCGSPENAESIYNCDLSVCDPIAIEQNLICNIEKMMGIFPNIPKLRFDDIPIIELEDDEG